MLSIGMNRIIHMVLTKQEVIWIGLQQLALDVVHKAIFAGLCIFLRDHTTEAK